MEAQRDEEGMDVLCRPGPSRYAKPSAGVVTTLRQLVLAESAANWDACGPMDQSHVAYLHETKKHPLVHANLFPHCCDFCIVFGPWSGLMPLRGRSLSISGGRPMFSQWLPFL